MTNDRKHGYLYAKTDDGNFSLIGKMIEKIKGIEKGNTRNDILEARFGIPMTKSFVTEREAREVRGNSENSTDDVSNLYLRFGHIPKDKVSNAYRSGIVVRSEKGISVWNCAFVNDVPFPLLPDNASESCMADYFYFLLGDRPVYLVTGTELEEKGSAGEPLLDKDIQIVREYTEDYKYLKKIHTKYKEEK